MHPSTRSNFSRTCLKVCQAVVMLIVTGTPVFAANADRLMVRDSVSQPHRNELVDRLRTITGWADLAFDDDVLRLSNASPANGSTSARKLLTRAVSGNRMILLEDASSRKDVIFCRVSLGRFVREIAVDADIYVVLIDFDDFRRVLGDKQARAAFDVGWAVLHELDHVVQGSQDSQHNAAAGDPDTAAGDCESHINKMRRELGLPVRNSYFFTLLPVKNDANLVSRFVRLGFDQAEANSTKKKRYWLIWDAAIVGGVDADCSEASDRTLPSSADLLRIMTTGDR